MTELEREVRRVNRRINWYNFRQNAKQKVVDAVHWINENKEAIIIVTTGLGVAAKLGRSAMGNAKVNREQHYKDTHIYDHSTGAYVELKKKLKQDDWKKVQDLKLEGLSTTQALMKLNLVK